MQKTNFTVGNYELQNRLGDGKFAPAHSSKVRYAVNKLTNEAVAVKYFDKETLRKENVGEQFKRDIFTLKGLRNKHVIDVKDMFANTTKFFVVMSLAEGGHFFDLLTSVNHPPKAMILELCPHGAVDRLNEPRARFYMRQLIDGVQFCHSNGFYLGDISPEVRSQVLITYIFLR
jgi:serine/threonine protein kinase